MASLHRCTAFLGARMFDLGNVFKAMNQVFGKDLTTKIVVEGIHYFKQRNDITIQELGELNRKYSRML